jgi:opacity protein-like surface antigen
MNKKVIYRTLIFAGTLLLAGGAAVAQDGSYGRWETSPEFTYVHTSPVLGGAQSFNCAGAGGTFAYNLNSLLGVAADLGSCKVFGLDNTYGVGSKVHGNEFTYVFGPRVTFRHFGKFQPFTEINFGGERVSVGCNHGDLGNACGALSVPSTPTTPGQLPANIAVPTQHGFVIVPVRNPNNSSVSKNAFAMTVGGGLDLKLNKRFALRLVQAEYLYTHFGNGCEFAICSNNNGQNSFRLKSGVVMSWGGAK